MYCYTMKKNHIEDIILYDKCFTGNRKEILRNWFIMQNSFLFAYYDDSR